MNVIFSDNDKIQKGIENYLEAREQYYASIEKLRDDLIYLLKTYEAEDDEIELVFNVFEDSLKGAMLISYIINGDEKNIRDIIRQAYVIEDSPIPYQSNYVKEKTKLTKEQIKELNNTNMPYSIIEIEKEDDNEISTNMVIADYDYLNKLFKKKKTKKNIELLSLFENEYLPAVEEKDVKEIHIYYPDLDEDIKFMDAEGLHYVSGKKAKIEFLNNKTKIGYLGSDFIDEDGEDCLGLFEAFDRYHGFYDYHIYKLKDLLRMDVLFYPREEINFGFEIKVRHMNKVISGMTEKKKKKI